MIVSDVETLRLHYAYTLRHWLDRATKARAKIEKMYDERFFRMWEFSVISAEMMFHTGGQLVSHMQLAKKRDATPMVRSTSPTRSGSIWRSVRKAGGSAEMTAQLRAN